MTELPSWNDTRTTQAIVKFSETAARDVSPEEQAVVFAYGSSLAPS